MRIRRLTLHNFRCFESLDLELNQRLTLLVGTNGSGKTAVLDGIAIALGAWLGATSQAGKEDRTIAVADARLVRQEGDGLATANPIFPVRVAAEGELRRPQLHDIGEVFLSKRTWARELRSPSGRTTIGEASEVRQIARDTENEAAHNPSHPLPLVAYYGTGRLWVQKKLDRQHESSRLLQSRMGGYAACLEFASNHKHFERWMADREADRVQRLAAAQAAGQDFAHVQTPHLEAVQDIAMVCLEGACRFFYSINHGGLLVEFKDGQILPFASLSDGQRSLIVLAADLAWRSVQLNPHLGRTAPQQTPGVVLIDEIELHLHPQWQRTVIGKLTGAFPKVQFVMTTHSPQVVSNADPECLRVIHSNGSWEKVDYTRGRDSNALLRDVFGVTDRPDYVRGEVNRIEKMLASADVEQARLALHRLSVDLGPDDDLVTGLRWELHELEVNGPLDDGEDDDAASS